MLDSELLSFKVSKAERESAQYFAKQLQGKITFDDKSMLSTLCEQTHFVWKFREPVFIGKSFKKMINTTFIIPNFICEDFKGVILIVKDGKEDEANKKAWILQKLNYKVIKIPENSYTDVTTRGQLVDTINNKWFLN